MLPKSDKYKIKGDVLYMSKVYVIKDECHWGIQKVKLHKLGF